MRISASSASKAASVNASGVTAPGPPWPSFALISSMIGTCRGCACDQSRMIVRQTTKVWQLLRKSMSAMCITLKPGCCICRVAVGDHGERA